MQLRTETAIGIGLLLVLQLLTSFAAIGLLSRMSPAVEEILRENVASEEAVEQMLAILASPTRGGGASEAERFYAILDRAEKNITEEAERPIVERIEQAAPGALQGDAEDRAAAVAALQELGAVNRASMEEADRQARLLGASGAWAAVILGFVGFVAGLVVYRRLRERLEAPIQAVDRALCAARAGDPHHRCLHLAGPAETERIARNLNWLLDELERAANRSALVAHDDRDRRVLLHLIDRDPQPCLIVDREDDVLAENRAALDLPAEERRALLESLAAGRPAPPGWSVSPVRDGLLWICIRQGGEMGAT